MKPVRRPKGAARRIPIERVLSRPTRRRGRAAQSGAATQTPPRIREGRAGAGRLRTGSHAFRFRNGEPVLVVGPSTLVTMRRAQAPHPHDQTLSQLDPVGRSVAPSGNALASPPPPSGPPGLGVHENKDNPSPALRPGSVRADSRCFRSSLRNGSRALPPAHRNHRSILSVRRERSSPLNAAPLSCIPCCSRSSDTCGTSRSAR